MDELGGVGEVGDDGDDNLRVCLTCACMPLCRVCLCARVSVFVCACVGLFVCVSV